MVINKFNENLVQQFIKEAVNLYNYTSSKNILGNLEYDAKYSTKLGKALDKLVVQIIKSPVDIEDLIKLLDDKNNLIAYLAAEYLYPIYPNKCLKIMRSFYDEVDDKIDKYTIQTKLDGISKQENFFMETYKKLYSCDNLDDLNRET